jgi:hypothetical protein
MGTSKATGVGAVLLCMESKEPRRLTAAQCRPAALLGAAVRPPPYCPLRPRKARYVTSTFTQLFENKSLNLLDGLA